MKKIWKNVFAIVCSVVMMGNLAACMGEEKEIINAYDIAVQNGFKGTEKEWLESLKGANGMDAENITIQDIYAEAVENGFQGSFLDFLREYFDVGVQEDNDTEMIANNMLSVVGIYAGFTKGSSGGAWWQGSSSSEEKYTSAGSGVIIDLNKEAGNALILTNYHVVYDAECNTSNHISDAIYLYPYGAFNQYSTETLTDEKGDGIKATFVGGGMDYDVALLKVEGSEFIRENLVTEARIGDSEKLCVGEKVFAVGNPDGAGISVVNGVISVESEYINMAGFDDGERTVSFRVMRTDAPINGGNSGGGLFNAAGELIGITNAKDTGSDIDNMCYALPINLVKNLCDNILDNDGVVMRAMLGVMAEKISSKAVMENGRLYTVEEIIVSSSEIETTAAAYNNLRFYDKFISLTIYGETYPITKLHHVNDLLLKVRKGDTITIKVLRDGVETDISITYDKDAYFKKYS